MDSGVARVIDGRLCVSSAVMQEWFGVSRQALGNWAKAGCPKAKAGWWPVGEVIKWRGLGGSAAGKSDAELSDGQLKLKYEAEWKRLQAEQLELKNAIAVGDYVARTELVSELTRYFIELKRSLTGLSRKLSTEVGAFVDAATARRIEREMSEIIAGALERMSVGEIYVPNKRREVGKRGKAS